MFPVENYPKNKELYKKKLFFLQEEQLKPRKLAHKADETF